MITLSVFIPFALGYFLSYLFRAVNAVIAPDLVADLGLDAADLGLLTSAYFLTFAAFQIPLGILLDRFGPRRTEAALLAFAALGAFVFAQSDTLIGLIAGRALIGLGVSACLMAAFKAFVMWFDRQRLPLINGIQMGAGGLGAMAATAPVEAALDFTDWRGVFTILAVATAAIALVIYLVVPKKETGHSGEGLGGQMGGVAEIFTSPVFWRIAPLTVMSQASFLSIQSLWSGPWLRDVAGLDRGGVAEHLLMIAAAMIAGFLLIGLIAERLGRLGIHTAAVAVIGMSAFMLAQAAIVLQWTDSGLLAWIFFGFFGTAGILPYAALLQGFRRELAGRVVTGLNVIVFAAAFAGQWGIGAVIDLWPQTATGGYDADSYQAAFAMMLALQVLALAWLAAFKKAPLKLFK